MAFGLIAGLPYRGPGSFSGKGGSGKTYSAATSRLGNLGGIARSKAASYSGKSPGTAVSYSARKGRLGNFGLIGRVGAYTGKLSVPDTVLDYSNQPSITITPRTYSLDRDVLLEYIGVEIVAEANDFEIVIGGAVLDYTNQPSITIQSAPYSLEADEPDTVYVDYSQISTVAIQSQQGYRVQRDILLQYENRPSLTIQASPGYALELPVLGEQTLSNLDYINIANQVVKRTNTVSGLSLEKQLNVILAATAGTAFNFKPAGQTYTEGEEFGYYGTDGVTKVIRGTYVGGNRVIIDLNPED